MMSNYTPRLLLLLLTVMLARMAFADTVLKPVSLEKFFLTANQPVDLHWAVEPAAGQEIGYTITDYWDHPVADARATVTADAVLVVPVKLAPGYYDITFPETHQTFGICALLPRRNTADPFFGIDSALSWLAPADTHTALINNLKRCGISMARERLYWGEVSPAADKWNGATKYTPVRAHYQQQGIRVLELFHEAPVWTGKVGTHGYPQDLLGTMHSWQTIGKNYGPSWGGLEIWNEPDLAAFAGDASPDQLLPMVKAISYGFRQTDLKTPLVGGVFSSPTDDFLRACAQNGLLDAVDGISFHNYGSVLDVERQVGRYRDWLRENGKEAMPLWITECGKSWKRGPARPPQPEAAASALDIVMKGVEARACGVARYFPFVYPFYEENDANYAMLGKEYTPLRAMAAYAYMAQALSGVPYIGDLATTDPAIQRARVFLNGERVIIVLYTGQPKADASVKQSLFVRSIAGIDGRPLTQTDPTSIPVPDGLCYIVSDLRMVMNNLRTDSTAAALVKAARQAPPVHPEPSPVILSFRAHADGASSLISSSQGYWTSADQAKQFPVRVRLSNLSDQAHTVSLRWLVTTPNERSKPTDGPTVEVPAQGTADVQWTADVSALQTTSAVRTVLITANCADDIPAIAPLALPITIEPELSALLKCYPTATPLDLTDLAKWHEMVAADGHMTMSITPDKHWLLNVTFGKSDPWVYPQLATPPNAFTNRQALVIRAKCANPASVRVILWETGGAGYFTNFPTIPADGKWHAVALPFDKFTPLGGTTDANNKLDLDQISKISLGMNSPSKENTLEFSDVYVAGK